MAEYYFDGGDCCGKCVNKEVCTDCICNENINSDEGFDAEDCCLQCKSIMITLGNNALQFQGSLKGSVVRVVENYRVASGIH